MWSSECRRFMNYVKLCSILPTDYYSENVVVKRQVLLKGPASHSHFTPVSNNVNLQSCKSWSMFSNKYFCRGLKSTQGLFVYSELAYSTQQEELSPEGTISPALYASRAGNIDYSVSFDRRCDSLDPEATRYILNVPVGNSPSADQSGLNFTCTANCNHAWKQQIV